MHLGDEDGGHEDAGDGDDGHGHGGVVQGRGGQVVDKAPTNKYWRGVKYYSAGKGGPGSRQGPNQQTLEGGKVL